ncbi:hypothetical protein KQX54_005104 [Cotesia glomerata]|uniref:Uncharacterized protein n=1 Tax=Cotesia glomerata TaxID=32391 RepID=A0AAV7HSG0_COTGL|nr:hypothetical protein KQX54_005104 [Cotesia glomerata]
MPGIHRTERILTLDEERERSKTSTCFEVDPVLTRLQSDCSSSEDDPLRPGQPGPGSRPEQTSLLTIPPNCFYWSALISFRCLVRPPGLWLS